MKKTRQALELLDNKGMKGMLWGLLRNEFFASVLNAEDKAQIHAWTHFFNEEIS